MGAFPCCPTIKRFCCCTKSLNIAVLCILFLSMLAGICAVTMCLDPSCGDMFNPDNKGLVDILNIVKWVFLAFTILLLVSCFVCFLAIYLQRFPCRRILAGLHVVISFVWSLTAVAFAVIEAMHFMAGDLKCKNPRDFVTVLLFAPCMMYFTCVINSYIGQAEYMK